MKKMFLTLIAGCAVLGVQADNKGNSEKKYEEIKQAVVSLGTGIITGVCAKCADNWLDPKCTVGPVGIFVTFLRVFGRPDANMNKMLHDLGVIGGYIASIRLLRSL